MSTLNSSLRLATAMLALGACAGDPRTDSDALDAAVAEARAANLPATQEEIEAAGRTDPLTRANFWSKEYEKNPANLDTALAFVSALREIGSDARALDIATRTAVLHPDSDALLLETGRAYLSLGRDIDAITAFQNAVAANDANAAAHAALALALDKRERHRDAQLAYERALELEPGRYATRSNYALSLALTSDLASAERNLRQALDDAGGQDLRIRENLAMVLGLQGRFDEMRAINADNAPARAIAENEALLRAMTGAGDAGLSVQRDTDATHAKPEDSVSADTPKAAPAEAVKSEPISVVDPVADAPRAVPALRGSLSD